MQHTYYKFHRVIYSRNTCILKIASHESTDAITMHLLEYTLIYTDSGGLFKSSAF